MTRPIKRIAISTGGGDAPGLNAVIRATVSAALGRGWECVGIRDGYNGLLDPGRYPQGGLVPLTHERVRGISHLGRRRRRAPACGPCAPSSSRAGRPPGRWSVRHWPASVRTT